MDKPARRAVVAVQTRPEQPEAPPLLVLDPVIVADHVDIAGPRRLPPFIPNPPRPGRPRPPIAAAPPGEPKRRVVGQQPECLDGLRRLEQPDWPLRFSPPPPPRGVPPPP